uniref:Uncharacterized protein n=1 Tax=Solenopsis bivonae TaxID=2010907 RepID=A0A1Z2R6D9_9ASTR|nr:hypothetical protein So_biv1Pt0573 [Solenopsis bivonae]ASA39279.1 hypothetical protein So_biv1Pt0573 [Solenopsis bivonae]
MNFFEHSVDINLFRLFSNINLDFLVARLSLKSLLTYGRETNSLSHRIVLTYLLNKGLQTRNLFDRLALCYMLNRGNRGTDLLNRETNWLNRGVEKTSLFDKLVRAYLVHRDLAANCLFDPIARAFRQLLKNGLETNSWFDKAAFLYLRRRCDEAFYKSMPVLDVFDVAKVEGINLIDRNLQRLFKTPLSWETAKIAVSGRLIEALNQENTHEFQSEIELQYWIGALERLQSFEKEENSESD